MLQCSGSVIPGLLACAQLRAGPDGPRELERQLQK